MSTFRCPGASCQQLLLLLSPLLLLLLPLASAASIGKQGNVKKASCSDLTNDLLQLLKANRELVLYSKTIPTTHDKRFVPMDKEVRHMKKNEWIYLQHQLLHFYAEVFNHNNEHKSETIEKGMDAFHQLNRKFTRDPYAKCKSSPTLNATAKNCSGNIEKGINDLKVTHLKKEVIDKALNEIELLEKILNVKPETKKPKRPGKPKKKSKSGIKREKHRQNRERTVR